MTTILQLLAIAFYACIFGLMAWEGFKRYIRKNECTIRIVVDNKTGLEYFLTESGGICPRMATHDRVKGAVHAAKASNDEFTVMPFVGKVQ